MSASARSNPSSGGAAVLPDLEELLVLRGLAQGLAMRARRSARILPAGAHHSSQRGRGLEFQEVRPYVPGDDPRSIDWRVTARRGRAHTKLFREERERPVWLLVDLSPAMYFGTRGQLKSAVAVRAAALLAWVSVLGSDRVGAVICAAGECRVLPPRLREAGVLPLLAALVELQPRSPGVPRPRSLESALGTLAGLARAGSVILAVSDFAELDSAAHAQWSALRARSACRLFWVCDPIEERALPNGRFRGGLPGRLRILDGAHVRARWLESWGRRKSEVEALARLLAAPLVRLDTSAPVHSLLAPELAPSGPIA
ncbi:MAG TPA: DUF58 domain-containing protein [Steroidobacteraceae bacterium]|nr:DUF58 domain-containing protein [Steroidobacteraceae bacterium]